MALQPAARARPWSLAISCSVETQPRDRGNVTTAKLPIPQPDGTTANQPGVASTRGRARALYDSCSRAVTTLVCAAGPRFRTGKLQDRQASGQASITSPWLPMPACLPAGLPGFPLGRPKWPLRAIIPAIRLQALAATATFELQSLAKVRSVLYECSVVLASMPSARCAGNDPNRAANPVNENLTTSMYKKVLRRPGNCHDYGQCVRNR